LGANLLGQERAQSAAEGIEEGSTSGVSTVNSVKSQKTSDSFENNKYWHEYRDQMGSIKIESMKLLYELLESQKSYQSLLCQALEEQKAQLETLTELCNSINRKILKKNFG
jgi:mitogen-activated protein kinase kinase kinase 5